MSRMAITRMARGTWTPIGDVVRSDTLETMALRSKLAQYAVVTMLAMLVAVMVSYVLDRIGY